MRSHERFEELCAVAAAGDLSVAERQELDKHLDHCARCRQVWDDMQEIHDTWFPQRGGLHIKMSADADARLRQAILQRVAAEGANFSEEALTAAAPNSHLIHPASQRLPNRSLAIAAAVILAVVGVRLAFWLNRSNRLHSDLVTGGSVPAGLHSSSPRISVDVHEPTATDDLASRLEVARQNERQAEEEEKRTEAALSEARADTSRLERKLAELWNRARALQESNDESAQEISTLEEQLETARAQESKADALLSSFKTSLANQEANVVQVEAENGDLRNKLADQAAGIDRERELLAAGREIRDLIAARNLHIIDVYDTSGEGDTRKSFGRVFYTEGKSLVFYAYDLPARRPAAKYAFYAWGKRDVSGNVKVRNLGIFYNDDQTQKRWVLRITDPNVLAEIDSVFVTLEKTDAPGNVPIGKKLLSAYLGTPANHP